MRYGRNLGCRYGQPHDMKTVYENPRIKIEICTLCRVRKRYNKGIRGRIDSQEYLRDHVRNFCQKTGPTRRVYNRVYYRDKCTISL